MKVPVNPFRPSGTFPKEALHSFPSWEGIKGWVKLFNDWVFLWLEIVSVFGFLPHLKTTPFPPFPQGHHHPARLLQGIGDRLGLL